MCADTGLPRYYVKIGNEANIDGNMVGLEKNLRQAIVDMECMNGDWEVLVATMEAGVEMLLDKEEDGKWRLVQERILPPDETAHDQLVP